MNIALSPKLLAFLVPAALVVPLDQWSKAWVVSNIPATGPPTYALPRPVIDGFFYLSHQLNDGIVFGWLQGGSVPLFVALTLLAVALIFSFYRQVPLEDLASATALGLILGGAVGNLIDRLARGAVVDFLHFDFRWFIYPDFNLADSAIVVGVAILLLRRGAWGETNQHSAEAAAE